nr:protein YLS3 [Tanacetum cinerariifolium]
MRGPHSVIVGVIGKLGWAIVKNGSVNFDIASCTGAPSPSMPPTPQVSLGSTTNTTTNSTVASSPMTSTTVTPKAGFMGLGYHPNYATKFKGSFQLRLMAVLAILTCLSTSILR